MAADAVHREVDAVKWTLTPIRVLCRYGILLSAFAAGGAGAEVDLSGNWINPLYEDSFQRTKGSEIGQFEGLPINAAARMRGNTWNAEILTVPEHQCDDYPPDYQPSGPHPNGFVFWREFDPLSKATIAWHTRYGLMTSERTLWMQDYAPSAPSANAPYTWQGFSVAHWERDTLVVTTTHLKTSWIIKNGLPRSDRAKVVEHITRHGDVLTIVTTVYDPDYLTEPLVRSRDFIFNPHGSIGPYVCEIAEELDVPPGTIPHHLPGKNPYLHEYPDKYQLPFEATQGGAATMYPEYRLRLRELMLPTAGTQSPPRQTTSSEGR